mgnify:CR=1 FL=1
MAVFTLCEPTSFEQDIKKSRFLSLAAPVDSASQALAFSSKCRAVAGCWRRVATAVIAATAINLADDDPAGGRQGERRGAEQGEGQRIGAAASFDVAP